MPPMKTDSDWLEEFRARYADWWPPARPLIEQHDYATAFKTYPWPVFTTAPWTPVTKPLAESRIGVVTTGGLYRAGVTAWRSRSWSNIMTSRRCVRSSGTRAWTPPRSTPRSGHRS